MSARASIHRLSLLAFTVFSLAGCDFPGGISRSPEDRINEAFPISEVVALTKGKIEQLLSSDSSKQQQFLDEFKMKQRVRALTCAAGYEPSLFDSKDDVRKDLTKGQCFIEFDAEQLQWLKLRRVAILTTSSPLRAIPEKRPMMVTASGVIRSVAFAQNAGVAVVMSNRVLEVIDIATDKSIFTDNAFPQYSHVVSLSPNGRAFAYTSRGNAPGTLLREAETGEVLAEFPEFTAFEWLDGSIAWLTRRNGQGSELIDLSSGKTAAVKGISSVPTLITRLPGTGTRFVARSHGSITTFSVRSEEGLPQISLLSQRVTPPTNWSAHNNAITVDGKTLVQGSGKLLVSDLAAKTTDEISLQPFSALSIAPLPGPQELLVNVTIATNYKSTQQLYVFDTSDRTFASVEDERFAEPAGTGLTRTVYVPSTNSVALISGATLVFLDDVKRSYKFGLQAFVQQLQEQSEGLRQKAAVDAAVRNYGDARLADVEIANATGGMPEVAKGARIEAVGVYQSAGAPSRPGQPAGRGPVAVLVRKSSSPIVLVLSSYDPVDWRIHIDPRAELKAILLSSYGESTVQGAGTVRVTRMGQTYAYDRNSSNFRGLQREVARWTGKPIDMFQGTYKASTFTVGGT